MKINKKSVDLKMQAMIYFKQLKTQLKTLKKLKRGSYNESN